MESSHLSLDLDAGIRSGEAELARHAEELGVTAQWRLVAAPFVITGNIDGRGFYLRERHGHYCVTIAPDDDPAADPWELPAERATLDIADGEDDDLTGPDAGIQTCLAVLAVRAAAHRLDPPISNPVPAKWRLSVTCAISCGV